MKNKYNFLVASLVASGFFLLLFVLLNTHYIPLRYRLIVGTVALIFVMLVLILTKRQIFRVVLAGILVITSVVVFNSQALFNNVSTSKEFETVKYALLAQKIKSSYSKVGYYNVYDDKREELFNDIKEAYPIEEFIAYEDMFSLAQAAINGDIDAVIVHHNLVSEIALVNEQFLNHVFVIDYFTINIPYELVAKPVDVSKEPFIVYVSGIDVYGDVNLRSRSDLNLLLVVNPQKNEVLTVSIPRDTYMPLGCEKGAMDKLTHAGLYGVSCSVKTIEDLLDIDINYYVRINFTGLVDVVDHLGGVEVYSPLEFTTDAGDVFIKGLNEVDGRKALVFARERNNVPDGDIDRGINHQELIKAIFQKATSLEELPKLPSTLKLIQNVLSTNFGDANFSKIMNIQMEDMKEWTFKSTYLKGTGDMQVVHSLDSRYKYYVYWPDQNSVSEIQSTIAKMMK